MGLKVFSTYLARNEFLKKHKLAWTLLEFSGIHWRILYPLLCENFPNDYDEPSTWYSMEQFVCGVIEVECSADMKVANEKPSEAFPGRFLTACEWHFLLFWAGLCCLLVVQRSLHLAGAAARWGRSSMFVLRLMQRVSGRKEMTYWYPWPFPLCQGGRRVGSCLVLAVSLPVSFREDLCRVLGLAERRHGLQSLGRILICKGPVLHCVNCFRKVLGMRRTYFWVVFFVCLFFGWLVGFFVVVFETGFLYIVLAVLELTL